MKTRKIISTLISVIMLMHVLMTGTFTASAQTTTETLATPTNICYSNNTIAWTHNKENIKTFRVNFYALSTDGEYFHLQSNYDGDLKTNTSFSLYDELWAHFNECTKERIFSILYPISKRYPHLLCSILYSLVRSKFIH